MKFVLCWLFIASSTVFRSTDARRAVLFTYVSRVTLTGLVCETLNGFETASHDVATTPRLLLSALSFATRRRRPVYTLQFRFARAFGHVLTIVLRTDLD